MQQQRADDRGVELRGQSLDAGSSGSDPSGPHLQPAEEQVRSGQRRRYRCAIVSAGIPADRQQFDLLFLAVSSDHVEPASRRSFFAGGASAARLALVRRLGSDESDLVASPRGGAVAFSQCAVDCDAEHHAFLQPNHQIRVGLKTAFMK